MPTPSKRGRKKKSMLPREGPVTAHALPTGSDALILAHLAAGGQVSLMVKDLHISMLGYLKLLKLCRWMICVGGGIPIPLRKAVPSVFLL